MLINRLTQAFSSLAGNFAGALSASVASNAAGVNATSASSARSIVAHDGKVYFPASTDMQRLLSLDTASADEVDAAFAGAARQANELRQAPTLARIRRNHAGGQHEVQNFFAHDAASSVLGVATENRDELMRLARGEITIAAGNAALLKAVKVIPAGTLEKDFQRFRGWHVKKRPTTWHSVYPQVASGRRIASVTQLQADGTRKPVQVAVHANRHSYSLDGGLSWTPTGAVHGSVSEMARASAWARFFTGREERARTMQLESHKGHGG